MYSSEANFDFRNSVLRSGPAPSAETCINRPIPFALARSTRFLVISKWIFRNVIPFRGNSLMMPMALTRTSASTLILSSDPAGSAGITFDLSADGIFDSEPGLTRNETSWPSEISFRVKFAPTKPVAPAIITLDLFSSLNAVIIPDKAQFRKGISTRLFRREEGFFGRTQKAFAISILVRYYYIRDP